MSLRESATPASLSAVLPSPAIIPTDPTSTFTNSTAAGVNRIVSLTPDAVLVNNIGRNCELWHLDAANPGLEVRERALFNRTIFPGQDFPSIFDIDAHAAFLVEGGATLLLCNHYGLIRYFDLTATSQGALHVAGEVSLPGDTERLLLVQGCLIASSPRGQYTADPEAPGILISEPLPSLRNTASQALVYRSELPDWGAVTALAADPSRRRLAVGSPERLGLFRLERDSRGISLGECLWHTSIPYLPQWISFDGGDRLLVAGYDAALADPLGVDWDALNRGGFDAYSLTGDLLLRASLPDETAWGYGADPVVPSPDYEHLFALDRTAGLHQVSTNTGRSRQLFSSGVGVGLGGEDTTFKSISESVSQGIGHAELIRGSILAGFSRGGYRLFRYDDIA